MDHTEVAAAVERLETTAVEAIQGLRGRLDHLEARMQRPRSGGGYDGLSEPNAETKAWVSFLRAGPERMDGAEVKSLITGDSTRGGYLAPPEFVARVLKGIIEVSPIRAAATVGTTSAGSVILPKRTTAPTAVWVGETEDRSETASAYGQEEIVIHEAACFIDVSQRLLEDAAVDVAGEVAGDLSVEFGRLEGRAFCAGSGVGQPEGFLSNSDVGFVANGHATVLQADALITLLYSLPDYYRQRGSWVMNSSTLAAVRKLKDGTGAYLWQPSVQLGQPQSLLSRPVIEAVDMPSIASGTFPIAFGDWQTAYRIYDKANGFSILRDPYSVATKGLVRFHARRRVGGQVVLGEACKTLKMSS
jgi:HK97 family phage major capsid protein